MIVNVDKTEQCSLPYGQSCMFVFVSLVQLTQNTKLKSMSSVFMQAIAATVCSRLPISVSC